MQSLWFFHSLLILLALVFVVIPILRPKNTVKDIQDSNIDPDVEKRRQKNIAVFEQTLAELEADYDAGETSRQEYEVLKTELQKSFLRDMESKEPGQKNSTGAYKSPTGKLGTPNWLALVFVLLFIPVVSIALYQDLGASFDLQLPELMDNMATAETEEAQLQALDDLAAFLQERFNRNAEDVQNGYMLGTLYLELGRHLEAVTVFEKLSEQLDPGPDLATVLGQLAQAQFMAADSQITPQVRTTIDRALQYNPNEYAVMSLLAIDAFMQRDFNGALAYWRRQLSQMDAGSQQAGELRQRIAMVESMIPESEQVTADAPVEGPRVTLIVDIDESLKALVDDSMRLFVFARNTNMPMPLAARNLDVPSFPFEITLDESMSMVQGMTLSSAENVIVGARLSRSGQATAQPGDIQGISEPFVLAEQTDPVRLTISEIVQ